MCSKNVKTYFTDTFTGRTNIVTRQHLHRIRMNLLDNKCKEAVGNFQSHGNYRLLADCRFQFVKRFGTNFSIRLVRIGVQNKE